LASNVARRLFRLPINWFEKRHAGDIISRFQSINPIQAMLTQGGVAVIIDGVMAILIFFLMLWYSPLLTIIATSAFVLYTIIRIASFRSEREAREASIVARGKEQTIFIESLRGITPLRLFGREAVRHALWQSRLADTVNSDARIAKISIWQSTGNSLLYGFEGIISVWFAIGMIISGDGFSIGMVFAFMTYKGQFLQKAMSLTEQLIALRMLGLHLERLSDIVLSDEDPSFQTGTSGHRELKGGIALRDVSYRYAPFEPLILDGLNLTVEPGEHIAITGRSGGGKTTLVKLLLGILHPEQGEFLVDGVPIARFGIRNLHAQVAAVMQDDSLFSGTLSDNIALFDVAIDFERITQAAKAASIHNDIMLMPMQYDTLVGDMGSALSGGQKQRVLLARALYRNPKILILDEGTAHLDSNHERSVNSAISDLGITRIIIAHRRETIASAGRVLEMRGSKLFEVPRHNIAREGATGELAGC